MEFKEGDIVSWCRNLGTVVQVFRSTIFCDFTSFEARPRRLDFLHSSAVGKLKPYHEEPRLSHAAPDVEHQLRLNPPEVSVLS